MTTLDAILNGKPVWADQEKPVDLSRFELMPVGSYDGRAIHGDVIVTCLDHLHWTRTVTSLASAVDAATQHHAELHQGGT